MQPTLTIHLDRIFDNFRILSARFTGTQTAAVVKANAYGLGAAEIAQTLVNQGAEWLFVATLAEGIALRNCISHAKIAVFHGPFSGEEATFIEHGLVPVINHIPQLERWMLITAHHPSADYMLHVDTGMCRLGLNDSDMVWLISHGAKLLARQPLYLLSHLACANNPDHQKNAEQLKRFTTICKQLGMVRTSLCNSSGIYLPTDFHGDLARPGSALYGINPTPYQKNPMHQVADLSAPVLMVRTLGKAETIGYGATYTAEKNSRIAVIQMGYADGLMRILSNKGKVFVGDVACKIAGRVSMDMIAVDVSHLAEQTLNVGMMVDIICAHQPVDFLAASADTIGYEIFTRLGDRVIRRYISDAA